MKNPYMDFDLELARQNLDSAAIAHADGDLFKTLRYLDLTIRLLQNLRRKRETQIPTRQPTGYYTRNVEE